MKQSGWQLVKILTGSSTNEQPQVDGQDVYDLCYTGSITDDTVTSIIFQNRVLVRTPTPRPIVIATPTPKPVVIASPSTFPTQKVTTATEVSPAPAQTPTAVTSTVPQTGDAFPVGLLAAIALGSAAALGILLYNCKKQF